MLSFFKRTPSHEELGAIIAPIAQKHGIVRVYLFGSRARGDNHRNSDYDLIVDFGGDFKTSQYFGFVSDLSKVLKKQIDVDTIGGMTGEYGKHVQKEMVLIYG